MCVRVCVCVCLLNTHTRALLYSRSVPNSFLIRFSINHFLFRIISNFFLLSFQSKQSTSFVQKRKSASHCSKWCSSLTLFIYLPRAETLFSFLFLYLFLFSLLLSPNGQNNVLNKDWFLLTMGYCTIWLSISNLKKKKSPFISFRIFMAV
jgi:hypothetical protein